MHVWHCGLKYAAYVLSCRVAPTWVTTASRASRDDSGVYLPVHVWQVLEGDTLDLRVAHLSISHIHTSSWRCPPLQICPLYLSVVRQLTNSCETDWCDVTRRRGRACITWRRNAAAVLILHTHTHTHMHMPPLHINQSINQHLVDKNVQVSQTVVMSNCCWHVYCWVSAGVQLSSYDSDTMHAVEWMFKYGWTLSYSATLSCPQRPACSLQYGVCTCSVCVCGLELK